MVKHLQTISGYTIDAVWGPPFETTPCPFLPGDHLAITRIFPLEYVRDKVCEKTYPAGVGKSANKIRAWGAYLRHAVGGGKYQHIQQRPDGGYDLLFSHQGIYLGNNRIIHFRGDPHLKIEETDMLTFIGHHNKNNTVVERVSYPNDVVLPIDETIRRAHDWCYRRGVKMTWQIMTHNCEQLATYCKIGKWKSRQTEILDTVTTDYLNELLWRFISCVVDILFALYRHVASTIWMYLIVICLFCYFVVSMWGEVMT